MSGQLFVAGVYANIYDEFEARNMENVEIPSDMLVHPACCHQLRPGDRAILQLSNASLYMVHVTPTAVVRLGRNQFCAWDLIGATYGTWFALFDGSLEQITAPDVSHYRDALRITGDAGADNDDEDDTAADAPAPAPSGQVVDAAALLARLRPDPATPLSSGIITALKDAGVNGRDLIKLLVAEKGAAFSSKTEFAQQKWLRRLEARHITRFALMKCTPEMLCNFSLSAGGILCARDTRQSTVRDKTWQEGVGGGANNTTRDFRGDMLADLTARAGLSTRTKRIIVHDELGGLLSTAAAWRLGGHTGVGGIASAAQTSMLVTGINRQLMVRQAFARANLVGSYLPRETLDAAAAVTAAATAAPGAPPRRSTAEAAEADLGTPYTRGTPYVVATGLPRLAHTTPHELGEFMLYRAAGRTGDDAANQDIMKPHLVAEDGRPCWQADAFVAATTGRLLPLMAVCMPFMQPGGRFALWTPYLEFAAEARQALRAVDVGASVDITECSVTPWVVRPGMCRPAMSFAGANGYILSGVATPAPLRDLGELRRTFCEANEWAKTVQETKGGESDSENEE